MYYSEKIENGKIYFKNSPDGEWKEFSQEQYAKRAQEIREKALLTL